MHFYWIQNHTIKGHLLIYWQPGITNLGDYHTKHHSPVHHQLMQPTYLQTNKQLAQFAIAHILWGCVNSRVLITVIHGSSFHRICPKPQSRPRRLSVVLRWNYWLESLTSILRPTLKLLTRVPADSSPRRLSFDWRWNYWLESQLSVLQPTQKLLTHILVVYPLTVATTHDSHPRRLSSDHYRN